VHLSGLTRRGELLSIELEGFAARVAQHETDHLDGVVYLDRMQDMSTLTDEDEFRRAQAALKSTIEGDEASDGNSDTRVRPPDDPVLLRAPSST
jgi:hypothetical protein